MNETGSGHPDDEGRRHLDETITFLTETRATVKRHVPMQVKPDVRELLHRDLPRLLDFLRGHRGISRDGAWEDSIFTLRLRLDPAYAPTLADVSVSVQSLPGMIALARTGITPQIENAARETAKKLRAAHSTMRELMLTVIDDIDDVRFDDEARQASLALANVNADHFRAQEEIASLARANEEAQKANEQAQERAARLQKAANEAMIATGQVGSEQLSEYFTEFSEKERRAANILRWVSAVAYLLTASITATLVLTSDNPAAFADEVAKLLAVLPLLALALYLTSESSKHRKNAVWAEQTAIKLRTLPAYARGDDERRGHYWMMMGACVFGANGNGSAAPDEAEVSAGITGVVDLIRRTTGLSQPDAFAPVDKTQK